MAQKDGFTTFLERNWLLLVIVGLAAWVLIPFLKSLRNLGSWLGGGATEEELDSGHQADQALQNLPVNHSNLSYPVAQYSILADSIYNELNGWNFLGYYETTKDIIYRQMLNKDDCNQLQIAFGTRDIQATGWGTMHQQTLQSAISSEMNTADAVALLQKLNWSF